MLRRALIAIATSLALTVAAPAQSPAEQAFIDYQTALEIDRKCHFFRYYETRQNEVVNEELASQLPFWRFRESNLDQYWIEYDKLADAGKAKAASIACTDNQAAAPYILTLRDRFNHYIYSDLMIAVEGRKLSEEQMNAARSYESLIQPIYGDNWQAFTENVQKLAQFRIDQANSADATPNPYLDVFGDYFDEYDYYYYDDEYDAPYGSELFASRYYLDDLIRRSALTADDILFEVASDTAGYRLRTDMSADGSAQVIGLANASGERQFDLWIRDLYHTLEKAGPIHTIFTISREGGIRIMTFGENARYLNEGSVTFLVHPGELPPDKNTNYSYMRSKEWLDGARTYKGTRADAACLGGPCFDLPPEALDDVLSGSYGQAVRFFFSVEADPAMPDMSNDQVNTGYTYALTSRQRFLDTETP